MLVFGVLVFDTAAVFVVADPRKCRCRFRLPAAGVQDALLSPSAATTELEESLAWEEEVTAFGPEEVIRRVTRAAQAAAKER